MGKIIKEGKTDMIFNPKNSKHKILLGIPTLGKVRYEWAVARYGQVIPVNWQLGEFTVGYYNPSTMFPTSSPMGFLVHDAYNMIAEQAVKQNFEWLVTIEDDVLIPQDYFVRIRGYIEKGDVPIMSGLYTTKSEPSEPLVFRGRGNGSFKDFKLGQKVWVDGIPMGCLLIHVSILKYLWDRSPEYQLPNGQMSRKVFDTPAKKFLDPEKMQWTTETGTQDLYFFDRVIKEKVLQNTGWKKIAKKKYPFLCDTSIFCKHIDFNSGVQYPLQITML